MQKIENSRDFPREQIHHVTPSAFQQIVPDVLHMKYNLTEADRELDLLLSLLAPFISPKMLKSPVIVTCHYGEVVVLLV